MIFPLDRLAVLASARQRGEVVDLGLVAELQVLDLAIVGREFARDAVALNEALDAMLDEGGRLPAA